MKILLVTHHWYTNSHHSKFSGYQRVAFYLARNHDVTVLTWGNTEQEYTEENFKVKMIVTPDNDRLFQRRIKISKVAAEMAPMFDITHLLYSDCGFHLSAKYPFIASVHVTPRVSNYKIFKEKVFLFLKANIIERRVFRNACKIIAVSNNLVEDLKRKYPEKSIYIPHGIDCEFWKPDPTLDKHKDEYLAGKFKKIVTCIGYHGVDYQIMREVIQQLPDVLFILVSLKEDFKYPNVIEKSGISNEELRIIYQVADAFYRPVLFATANNAVLEAMAMKKPIITNNIDGISDYLTTDNAFLPNNNSEHLAAVQNALEISPEVDKITSNAMLTANNEFSWTAVANSLVKIYQTEIK